MDQFTSTLSWKSIHPPTGKKAKPPVYKGQQEKPHPVEVVLEYISAKGRRNLIRKKQRSTGAANRETDDRHCTNPTQCITGNDTETTYRNQNSENHTPPEGIPSVFRSFRRIQQKPNCRCAHNTSLDTLFFDTGILYSIFYKNSSFL